MRATRPGLSIVLAAGLVALTAVDAAAYQVPSAPFTQGDTAMATMPGRVSSRPSP